MHALTRRVQDPRGLASMRARYYAPEVGRFLSEDPVQATNRYTCAFHSPVSAWDPYGLVAAIRGGDLVLACADDGGDWRPAPLGAAFEALSDGRV
jgi:RHS repeat-associated protein